MPDYFFSPPIREMTEPWRRETLVDERRFIGHFRTEPRAVNVHKLVAGGYTELEGLDPALIALTYRGSTRVQVTYAEAFALDALGYYVQNFTVDPEEPDPEDPDPEDVDWDGGSANTTVFTDDADGGDADDFGGEELDGGSATTWP